MSGTDPKQMDDENELKTGDLVTKEELDSAVELWNAEFQDVPEQIPGESGKSPVANQRNVLITSALPYVNNVPHLGNIIGSVLSGDVFARYSRLRLYNTLYICGTDEYGTATETKALQERSTPKKICEKYFKLHSEVYEWFNIAFDRFGRTSTEEQTAICQDMFWKVYNNGYCLEEEVEQLFCFKCERFLADRFVEGTCPLCAYDDARGDQCDKCGKLINAPELKKPRCKVCMSSPCIRSSKHLFIDLPKLEPKLKEWFQQCTEKVTNCWTQTSKGIAQAWLNEGLKPRCISRDLKWGTPIPLEGYEKKVFYTWFDAPIGYLSISAGYTKEWEKWWKSGDDVELFQFMAKDNVPFHSMIFPATEIATGEPFHLVDHLVAVEYLNYEGVKFSKSRGVGIFGDQAKDTGIDSDIFRFYLLSIRPETQDSSFSWTDLQTRNNSELLNNLGNFVNRALLFIFNNFKGLIPEIVLSESDINLIALINREIKSYVELMEKVKLRDALRAVLNISRHGNLHIQSNQPWVLIKGTEPEKSRAGSIMALCANIAALLSVILRPYTPETSDRLQKQLNINQKTLSTCCLKQRLPCGHQINKPTPLFRKLEQADMEKLKSKFAGAKPETLVKPAIIPTGLNSEELNNLISAQGDKVRSLKSAKAEKAVVKGEVEILLELKKRLASLSV